MILRRRDRQRPLERRETQENEVGESDLRNQHTQGDTRNDQDRDKDDEERRRRRGMVR